MLRMASGVYLVDDYPGEVQDQTQETQETQETENTRYFFCPVCVKMYRCEIEAGGYHEVFCESCCNLVLFHRAVDNSGVSMYLLF